VCTTCVNIHTYSCDTSLTHATSVALLFIHTAQREFDLQSSWAHFPLVLADVLGRCLSDPQNNTLEFLVHSNGHGELQIQQVVGKGLRNRMVLLGLSFVRSSPDVVRAHVNAKMQKAQVRCGGAGRGRAGTGGEGRGGEERAKRVGRGETSGKR
jgi:hypothetical protein